MDRLYEMHRDETEGTDASGKLDLSKIVSDVDGKAVDELYVCPVIRHPDLMPPTEFMALRMYPHC